MAIVDTVCERLRRFNTVHRRRRRRRGGRSPVVSALIATLYGLGRLGLWVALGLWTLAVVLAPHMRRLLWEIWRLSCRLARFCWFRVLPLLLRLIGRGARWTWRWSPQLAVGTRWIVIGAFLGLIGVVVDYEMRTSRLQSFLFTRLDQGMSVSVQPGTTQSIDFPKSGPYDERLGYSELPDFVTTLVARRYAIDSEARWSRGLKQFVHAGAFPVYPEKDQAGLRIFDRNGEKLYGAQFPQRTYSRYAEIPELAVRTLLFIEDRYLFDGDSPERNPAIEWNRFALAVAGRAASVVAPGLRQGGGSTLATQIEKFRHSPRGMTGGVGEKLRQMVTASARAYADGGDTQHRREAIVTTYFNSTPLASMPNYGEVIGIPEALWIWFGTDHAEATRILNETPRNAKQLARKGEVYRQVLALLLSQRRPSYLLLNNRDALAQLTDNYLQLLGEVGIISPALRDAALDAELHFRTAPPPLSPVSYLGHKATEDVRNKLVTLLKLPDLYSLDRLDLSAETAVDTAAQTRVTAVMRRLSDPAFLRASGMVGKNLLGDADPSKVTWSFVLYERGTDRNFVRIHADSLNKPFDINSGAKLMLGSTAKLRTLITYLSIIADLHDRFAAIPPKDLTRRAAAAEDPLTQWAATYLAKNGDKKLQPMLDAAMQRRYSGAPGSFFTGGGTQSFGNFDSSENAGNPTVEEAFHHSVNLAFVRLLHDIAVYETAASGVQVKRLLGDPADPQREAYLRRFVDADSRRFLTRFYRDYKGLDADQALDQLVERTRPIAKRLATVYLSLHPDARLAHLKAFLATHLPREELDPKELWDLYLTYSPERLNLADRGYVSGIHPLELWLVTYLAEHPAATFSEVFEASGEVRQQIYGWLFQGSTTKQDTRIKILIEQDAFARIFESWRALGYPFAHLVPSLGTAIGASGDRPGALAELMGIIVHDGVRVPTVRIERLRFAQNTPYETNLSPAAEPERVMPVEVARTVRRALIGVVQNGTARRLAGSYVGKDGKPLTVGGKTGTGDNRFDRFAKGGGIISSRVVDRTATFVFFLGDRFFGTVTAYVPGPDAARFHYTSALAVQLLKVLEPELKPLIEAPTEPVLVGSSSR